MEELAEYVWKWRTQNKCFRQLQKHRVSRKCCRNVLRAWAGFCRAENQSKYRWKRCLLKIEELRRKKVAFFHEWREWVRGGRAFEFYKKTSILRHWNLWKRACRLKTLCFAFKALLMFRDIGRMRTTCFQRWKRLAGIPLLHRYIYSWRRLARKASILRSWRSANIKNRFFRDWRCKVIKQIHFTSWMSHHLLSKFLNQWKRRMNLKKNAVLAFVVKSNSRSKIYQAFKKLRGRISPGCFIRNELSHLNKKTILQRQGLIKIRPIIQKRNAFSQLTNFGNLRKKLKQSRRRNIALKTKLCREIRMTVRRTRRARIHYIRTLLKRYLIALQHHLKQKTPTCTVSLLKNNHITIKWL